MPTSPRPPRLLRAQSCLGPSDPTSPFLLTARGTRPRKERHLLWALSPSRQCAQHRPSHVSRGQEAGDCSGAPAWLQGGRTTQMAQARADPDSATFTEHLSWARRWVSTAERGAGGGSQPFHVGGRDPFGLGPHSGFVPTLLLVGGHSAACQPVMVSPILSLSPGAPCSGLQMSGLESQSSLPDGVCLPASPLFCGSNDQGFLLLPGQRRRTAMKRRSPSCARGARASPGLPFCLAGPPFAWQVSLHPVVCDPLAMMVQAREAVNQAP